LYLSVKNYTDEKSLIDITGFESFWVTGK